MSNKDVKNCRSPPIFPGRAAAATPNAQVLPKPIRVPTQIIGTRSDRAGEHPRPRADPVHERAGFTPRVQTHTPKDRGHC